MKLHPKIEKALEGANWRIENGGRHRKLFVEDRFVGILPFGSKGDAHTRSVLAIRSQIRRALRNRVRD
jgi:hypothetical protein